MYSSRICAIDNKIYFDIIFFRYVMFKYLIDRNIKYSYIQ